MKPVLIREVNNIPPQAPMSGEHAAVLYHKLKPYLAVLTSGRRIWLKKGGPRYATPQFSEFLHSYSIKVTDPC